MDQTEKLITFLTNFQIDPEEIFKEIPGTQKEGTYFISNSGKVISLYYDKYSVLKPDISTGYERVKINRKNKLIHRLVAEAFCEKPKGKNEVHHKDGNERNNSSDNLVWLSQTEHREAHNQQRKKNDETT